MKKWFFLVAVLAATTVNCIGQYKGSKYIIGEIGLTFYDNVSGKIELNKTSSPKFTFGIGYGWQFSNDFKLELPFNYNSFKTDIIHSNTYSFNPTIFYSIMSQNKINFLIGLGGSVGYQSITTDNIYISIESKPNYFIVGGQIIPRFEFNINRTISLFANYKLSIHYNSIRRLNHNVGLGLLIYI